VASKSRPGTYHDKLRTWFIGEIMWVGESKPRLSAVLFGPWGGGCLR
jgi:hypothetical protein